MKLNADISELPWKKILPVIAIVALVAAGALWGWTAYNKGPRHPVTVEGNKALIWSYLKKHGQQDKYKPALDVASEKNPWKVIEPEYAQPPDYKTVYRSIGNHLAIAEHLLNTTEDKLQANGMRIAAELCDVAVDVAVDPWLAARICDAYIIPNLDKIEEKPKSGPSREHYINVAGKIYRLAEETDRQIELGKAYLAQTPSGQRADQTRWRLASELEKKGDKKEALKYFREISHPSLTNQATRKIVALESSLQNSRN